MHIIRNISPIVLVVVVHILLTSRINGNLPKRNPLKFSLATDGWAIGYIDGWIYGLTDWLIDGWMDEWMDGWMDDDGRVDGWVFVCEFD